MATTPSYPDQIKQFGSDVIDFSDSVLATHVNALRAEVLSLETVLGTFITLSSGWNGVFTRPNNSYTWSTLKDRLANIESGLSEAYDAMTPTGGTSGQVLSKSSSSDYDFAWTTISTVPSQSGNSGKYLTTNGTSASWTTLPPSSGANEFVLMMMGA